MSRKLGADVLRINIRQEGGGATALPNSFQPDKLLQQLDTYCQRSDNVGLPLALLIAHHLAEQRGGHEFKITLLPDGLSWKDAVRKKTVAQFRIQSKYPNGVGPAVRIKLHRAEELLNLLLDGQGDISVEYHITVFFTNTGDGTADHAATDNVAQDISKLSSRLTETAAKVVTQVVAGMTFADMPSAANYLAEALLRMLSLAGGVSQLAAVRLELGMKGGLHSRSMAYWTREHSGATAAQTPVAYDSLAVTRSETGPTRRELRRSACKAEEGSRGETPPQAQALGLIQPVHDSTGTATWSLQQAKGMNFVQYEWPSM